MTIHDVLVIGDANLDLVLRGDVVPRFGQAEQLLDAADLGLGGSASILACGLARLGLSVSLVAAIGSDPFGDITLDLLDRAGVGTGFVVRRREHATGISVVLSGGDRAILTHLGATASLGVGDLPALPAARHLHVASPYLTVGLTADLPALMGRTRGAGMSVSLDSNDDPARSWLGLHELLTAADVVLPNDGEVLAWARSLGGDPGTWLDAATEVAQLGPVVVVKAGAEGGALVASSGVLRQAAGPIVPMDTTGAGDSFDAGYLAAVLHGETPEVALRWAVAAGTASTLRVGGTDGQLTSGQLEAAVAALP